MFLEANIRNQLIKVDYGTIRVDHIYVQGKDSFGNIVEKGQKVEILLDGLSFEDKNGAIREVSSETFVYSRYLLM